jgi:hypothetical protein
LKERYFHIFSILYSDSRRSSMGCRALQMIQLRAAGVRFAICDKDTLIHSKPGQVRVQRNPLMMTEHMKPRKWTSRQLKWTTQLIQECQWYSTLNHLVGT